MSVLGLKTTETMLVKLELSLKPDYVSIYAELLQLIAHYFTYGTLKRNWEEWHIHALSCLMTAARVRGVRLVAVQESRSCSDEISEVVPCLCSVALNKLDTQVCKLEDGVHANALTFF